MKDWSSKLIIMFFGLIGVILLWHTGRYSPAIPPLAETTRMAIGELLGLDKAVEKWKKRARKSMSIAKYRIKLLAGGKYRLEAAAEPVVEHRESNNWVKV